MKKASVNSSKTSSATLPGSYDHKKIEPKWQKRWDKEGAFKAKGPKSKTGKKFYGLIEFPYPSGDGLHVGHIRSNTAMDIIVRKRRREGYDVLYPIGWDAFGLPTENYAIKTGIQPSVVTKRNTDTFRRQLKSLGFSFDWSREIDTTDPAYYKWTQWIFLQFFKKGLAYKKKMSINWCPKDLIGLANEEVVNGRCERCGTLVEKREKEQWMLAITKYAERLDKDLDETDFLEKIKIQQRNWIGRSEGAEIRFEVRSMANGVRDTKEVAVFTTRPDTLFGVTYIVLAPEHSLVSELLGHESRSAGEVSAEPYLSNRSEVISYISSLKGKTDIERTDATREKTGIELKGVKAVNPATREEVPVWIADYVLADYGTGAVMAVPAHDQRDFAFAKKYGLPVKRVIEPLSTSEAKAEDRACYTGDGILVNSGDFDGKQSTETKKAITEYAGGRWVTTYKLRDWVFSRQRYWGEPIPVVHCEKCGVVPVPEKDLPVKLPKVKQYAPTHTGESPLAAIDKWVNTKCPKCKGKAKRETDTMPQWAGSSWYYLRYTDPKNKKNFASKEALEYWLGPSGTPHETQSGAESQGGVDWYNGGMEHTTLHLLYSRFWHKFLYDLGLVPTKEPYKKRTSHGLILAEGGVKMSKSKGNVVNPDGLVETVGADSLRLYEMFMGPFDQPIAWNTDNIAGVRRFIERVWKLREKVDDTHRSLIDKTGSRLIHQTIKKVSEDIEAMRFNTAVSTMMIALNELEKIGSTEGVVARADYEAFLKLLAPFAPHVTEELWASLGNKGSIHAVEWPQFDLALVIESEAKIVVQVNGKVRASFSAPSGASTEELERLAHDLPEVKKWTEGKTVTRVVVVPGKLVNIVVA